MMKVSSFVLSIMLTAGAAFPVHAATSLAAGLPSQNYTSSGSVDHFNRGWSAEGLFNNNVWNGGNYGFQWVQVELLQASMIGFVGFTTNQLPDGFTVHAVYVDDNFIGDNWINMMPVASRAGYSANGTEYSFQITPTKGRYVEFVAYGGPSWSALESANVMPVPESEIYALFLAGLGVVGGFCSRNRKGAGRAPD